MEHPKTLSEKRHVVIPPSSPHSRFIASHHSDFPDAVRGRRDSCLRTMQKPREHAGTTQKPREHAVCQFHPRGRGYSRVEKECLCMLLLTFHSKPLRNCRTRRTTAANKSYPTEEFLVGAPYLMLDWAGTEISELCESSFWSKEKQSESHHC